MLLVFGKGSFQALKVIVTKYVTKTNVKIDIVEDGAIQPQLKIRDDFVLFGMNAAAAYLLKLEASDSVDKWLEWEACILGPLVHAAVYNYFTKKDDQSVVASLASALKCMETSVVGVLPQLDPILWSSLFPLVTAQVLADFDNRFPKLSKWFSSLAVSQPYQTAVKELFGQDVAKSLKEAVIRTSLPSLSFVTSMTSESSVPAGPSEEEKKAALDAWLNSTPSTLAQREHPILPKSGERNVLITSALPYVNNVPHLGNIIGCVLSADVFSRFCRLRGYNSLYICGTDEYGTATETKAMQEGLTPEQICTKYNAIHAEVYKWFNVDFDFFGRTTTQHQTTIAQDIFWRVYNNGFVIKDTVEQLKCEKCDRFLADRFVEGTCPLCAYPDARGDQCDKCGKLINAVELVNPKCKVCRSSPVVKGSEHLFLDLPKLEEKLDEYLQVQFKTGTWTANAVQITKSWQRDGLKPRCITRDLKWGTPVPLEGFTDKVFYVWFDAPIGYISIVANYTDQWPIWWKNPDQVELYNFMAKDNVPFHSVIFPCTLLGANDNYTIVNHLCSTEYLNYESDKFSKSRGVGVFGNDAKTTEIPADIWRFYLLYIRPESQDSSFSWDDFLLKNNSELLNNLGNFINRALKFVCDFYDGVIPEMDLIDEDITLLAQITEELKAYISHLEITQLREGIWRILSISRLANQYFQSTTPWKLVKSQEVSDRKRASTVVGVAANITCLLCLLVEPYMPSVSQAIRTQLNVNSLWKLDDKFSCLLKPGHKIGTPSPLFAKLDAEFIAELKKRFAGTQETRQAPAQKQAPAAAAAAAANPPAASSNIDQLTKEIEMQGNKVRNLKSSKADKATIDAEVATLLKLKGELQKVQAKANEVKVDNDNKEGSKTVDPVLAEKLKKEVEAQGNKVRDLKAKKADKSTVDSEVALLLKLKEQLSLAEGSSPVPSKSKKK